MTTRSSSIVDDDADLRKMLVLALHRAGFETGRRAAARRRSQLLRPESVDGVVLDLGMPGLSGTEVVTALRSDPETATLPILLMTGSGDDDTVVGALEAGADDFLSKPVRLDELVARDPSPSADEERHGPTRSRPNCAPGRTSSARSATWRCRPSRTRPPLRWSPSSAGAPAASSWRSSRWPNAASSTCSRPTTGRPASSAAGRSGGSRPIPDVARTRRPLGRGPSEATARRIDQRLLVRKARAGRGSSDLCGDARGRGPDHRAVRHRRHRRRRPARPSSWQRSSTTRTS